MSEQFKVQIGAKRQVTLPARLLELLSLEEGSEIQIYVHNDQATIVPMVSVPRHLVSPALLKEMDARRGIKHDDLTLQEFTTQVAPDMPSPQPQRVTLAHERDLIQRTLPRYRAPAAPATSMHKKTAATTHKFEMES